MVTERFSWYNPKGPVSTTNRYSSAIDSARNTKEYKRTSWTRKLDVNYEVLGDATGLEGLQAVESEYELATKMEKGNSYVKRDTYAQGRIAKYKEFLESKKAEILRNLDMEKSTLETAVTSYSTPQIVGPSNESLFYESNKKETAPATQAKPASRYSHMSQPIMRRTEKQIDATTLPLVSSMAYQPLNEFSSIRNQGERINTPADLMRAAQPRSTKKGRNSIALSETLGDIGQLAKYATKAAAIAIATLLPIKVAYAPTPLFFEKPAYTANVVDKKETVSNIEVPNLKLTEEKTKVDYTAKVVEKVKSTAVESSQSYYPKIETNMPITKVLARSSISLEKIVSPLHIDKVFAIMNERTARVPSDYIAREITKHTYVADTVNVTNETAPLPNIAQKPSIPDSFWEVRTPTGQIVYFNAGKTKPVTHVAHTIETPVVEKHIAKSSSSSEFIDADWFAKAQANAKRMERIRQPITKEYLAERMKPVEERASANSN